MSSTICCSGIPWGSYPPWIRMASGDVCVYMFKVIPTIMIPWMFVLICVFWIAEKREKARVVTRISAMCPTKESQRISTSETESQRWFFSKRQTCQRRCFRKITLTLLHIISLFNQRRRGPLEQRATLRAYFQNSSRSPTILYRRVTHISEETKYRIGHSACKTNDLLTELTK